MENPSPLRLQLPRPIRSDTDIYITRHMVLGPLSQTIARKIQRYKSVTLHSTGAANYHALKLAILLQSLYPEHLSTTVSTSTIPVRSYLINPNSTTPTPQTEKNINSVTILLTLK